ncbi:peptide deformylase [Casimicrobium huifangae]|jgi:peptide deformylase|uniref:peptide deformylase n=1 Tax=Casimicrobium huifangae TaxID=2591109 RepID=UPI0037843162
MAVREILRMGDPRLLRVAPAVPEAMFGSPDLLALIDDLLDTMRAASGAGIAAPQIGVDLRVVIFGGTGPNPRYPEAPEIPFTVLCNPILEPLSDERTTGWEGCLSVPGLRGEVPRFNRLRYSGRDASGALIDRTVDGFHARVVQHECDHLDGVLYPRRVEDLTRFGFTDVLFPALVA